MCDLKGRAIRTSHFKTPHYFGIADRFEIRTDGFELESNGQEIQINLYDLPPVMREGDSVMIGCEVKAQVVDVSRTSFILEVKCAGTCDTNSVVKVPSERAQDLPIVQLEDKIIIKEIAIKNNFDYIAIPSVMTSRDL